MEARLTNSQARESGSSTSVPTLETDLASELEDARAQMNDLILEIEAVISTEQKSKDQCGRLLQQILDENKIQSRVMHENSTLHLELKESKASVIESEKK